MASFYLPKYLSKMRFFVSKQTSRSYLPKNPFKMALLILFLSGRKNGHFNFWHAFSNTPPGRKTPKKFLKFLENTTGWNNYRFGFFQKI